MKATWTIPAFALVLFGCDKPSATNAQPAPSTSPAQIPASTDDALVGQRAPDFMTQTYDGKTIHLAGLKGQKVVLYFYPEDESPGCTAEACSLRDSFAQIKAAGAVLFGISRDDNESHRAFAANHQLPFSLISDSDGQIARLYAVPTSHGHTMRQTIVIGEDGRVRKIYRHVSVPTHAAEILADVRS